MHGLQTLKRINHDAAHAFARDRSLGDGLLGAPVAANFDHNIPWDFNPDTRVLEIHKHKDTRESDIIKLMKHVSAKHGPLFTTRTRTF